MRMLLATVCRAVLIAAMIGPPMLSRAANNIPLTGGGLSELPQEVHETVALTNAGFESDGTGWSPAKSDAFTVVSDYGAAHSGKSCLRFDGSQATAFVPSLRQSLRGIGSGVYIVRFWVKTRELGAKGKAQDGVRVSFEYQRQDGQRAWPSTGVFRGTSDWQRKELRVFVPADVKPDSVALSIGRYGGASGGEAFFDDFTVERVVPAAIEAFLLYPNYRGFLPEDGNARVRLWVKVNAMNSSSPSRVEVRDEMTKKQIAVIELPANTSEQFPEIDSSKWPLGSYTVQARLGDVTYPPYVVRKISTEQRHSMALWFDEEGVLQQNGKPTFVLGFYNGQGSDSVERLDELTKARPNFAIDYISWGQSLDEQRRYLANMQQRGITFLSTVNMVYPGNAYNLLRQPIGKELLPGVPATQDTQENLDRYLTRLAQSLRATPGHAGWYVMDERAFDQVPRHFRQYQLLRQIDADHPTYAVSDKPDELAFWRDTADVVGLDPYPLFNGKQDRPLSMVGDWTRKAVAATHDSRPVWMVLQFFQGWSADRWPTEEELRSMSLMAITEGARGIFYWTFGVRGLKAVKDPKEREEYWRRAVAVCQELNRLEPALVAHDAPDAIRAVSNPQIRWRARLVGKKAYVFAYLPAKKLSERFTSAVEVAFTLRDGQTVTRKFAPDTADWFVTDLK